MVTMEANVERYRSLICRCIREPTVVSYLSTVLTTDDASRIKNAFCNNQDQAINDLIDTVLRSSEQGKWPAFLEAIRKADLALHTVVSVRLMFQHRVDEKLFPRTSQLRIPDYPFLANLLEDKVYSHNQNGSYERKMIQIFSPKLEKQLMVLDIITELYSHDVITDIDIQSVRATLEQKGNTYATMVLLDKMQCRKAPKEWYGHFLDVLNKKGYPELVMTIEPDYLRCPSQFTPRRGYSTCDSSIECDESSGACGYSVQEHVMTDYEMASASCGNLDAPPAPPARSHSLVSSTVDSRQSRHSPEKKFKVEVKDEPDSESDSDDSNSLASDSEGGLSQQLRGYQLELAERAVKGENTIICAPTGSGKTWVALHIAEKHLQTFPNVSGKKIVFMARTGTLIAQQADMFCRHLPQFQTRLIQGDADEAGMIGEFLPDTDVLCLTPQILVNSLNSGSVRSLTKFSLLILDECHHTRGDEPYSVLMRKYLVEKYDDTRDDKLPQIVGLTASIGIGKSSTDVEARDYIMRVCALMDVKRLSTVTRYKEELQQYTSQPEEEIIKMTRPRYDPGREILLTAIENTEDKLKDLALLQRSLVELVSRKCPRDKESQEYNQWTVEVMTATYQSISDPDTSRNIRTCASYLNVYNQALEVNSLLQSIDVMKFLAEKHTSDAQQRDKLTDFERELLNSLQDVQKKLVNVERDHENPNVRNLSKILSDMLTSGGDESRAMVFVKARATCKALAEFLNEDLEEVEVRPLFGKDNRGNEEGMTQALQNETIGMFREGTYKVLVATSIGQEGIDVPSCNMVLNYNYTGNEITKIQMKGRIRKHGGRNVIIGDASMVEREKVNAYKEGIMQRAVRLYDDLPIRTIENKTAILQKEEMRKYKMKLELEKAKKRRQTNTGDYEIRCKRCNEFACYFSDIRKMDPHHIVVERAFASRVVLRPVKPPITFDGFINNFKLFCKNCPQEWGVLGLKDGFECRILTVKKLKFKDRETGRLHVFKRWIDVPVVVPDMTDEDLPRYFGENVDA